MSVINYPALFLILSASHIIISVCDGSLACAPKKLQTEGAEIQVGCSVNCDNRRITYGNSECTTMPPMRFERMQLGLKYLCQTGVCVDGACQLGAVSVQCWRPKLEDEHHRSPR
ncbi:uncharacterized protein LOC125944905 [Dermacentor silvarum]|uniref:uncharacterized protein LOC125944905 n=1 Tax=Dermacentor silvarum TaxID=543639 RepID=UPI002101AB51|nr:uncharacterized protein LOC125944905 [Dermacentor silvarum]